jgi:putative ABC transport system permease protein
MRDAGRQGGGVEERNDSSLERWYRRLARMYPAPFRDEYEQEMVALVRDRREERTGMRALGALWLELVVDVIRTAPREHARMLRDDLRHAVRVLGHSPALTVPVVLVLAIGIGATAAVFTLANAVLLRPLPFEAPDRLVLLDESAPKRDIPSMGTTFPNLQDYQRETRTLQGIAGYFEGFGGGFPLTGGGEPERVDGAWVSWNLFQVLGVRPVLGRSFTPAEDRRGVQSAVMISHGLWQRRYGGDPRIIGRSIQVGGVARTVVGVMPTGFRFPETGDVWAPLSLDPAENPRTMHFLTAIGRLRDGVTVEQAAAEMTGIMAGIRRRFPDVAGDVELSVVPLRERLTGEYAPVLVRLLGAAFFVLAIACTNVTNLLLARAVSRRREFAVRAAVGANRRRVVRQLLTESCVLGVFGGLAGLALGATIVPAILRSAPIDLPYWIHVQPDWRVLLFTSAIIGGTSLLFGIAPALHATGVDLTSALKESAGGSAPGTNRVRKGLVVVQLALSVVLLVGAGLMLRSLVNLGKVDLGFRAEEVLTFRLALPATRYQGLPLRAAFYERLTRELAALPYVRAAAATGGLPFGGVWGRTVVAEGDPRTSLSELPDARYVPVTPDYFRAMGIALRRGRAFTSADGFEAPVVILSQQLANRLWPGRDPIGRRLKVDPFYPKEPWRTVVGVVGDVRSSSPREEPPPTMYVPYASEPIRPMTVVVRGMTSMPILEAAARQVVRSLDRELPLAAVRPMTVVVERVNWTFRLYTQLFVVFAAVAILLAAVGLAGVMSHFVAERRREIGVRMALGAAPFDVVALVMRSATLLAAGGLVAGLIGAVLLARSLSSLLFGVTPEDSATLAAVLVLLTSVALVASWLPARGAARVNPIEALRTE